MAAGLTALGAHSSEGSTPQVVSSEASLIVCLPPMSSHEGASASAVYNCFLETHSSIGLEPTPNDLLVPQDLF